VPGLSYWTFAKFGSELRKLKGYGEAVTSHSYVIKPGTNQPAVDLRARCTSDSAVKRPGAVIDSGGRG
jgi:hypothetical protein